MMSATNTARILSLTRNKHVLNWLAWLLPLSIAGGSDLLAFQWLGATWYAFRCVVVLGAFIALLDIGVSRRNTPLWMWAWIAASLLWLGWALFNKSDAMDEALWKKGVFYLVIGIATLCSFYHIATNGKMKGLIAASNLGLAVNIGISIIQLFSSIRPDSAFTSELATYSSEHFVRFVPTGLFGNPNHFALYVCVQIFLLYTFRRYTVYTTRMVLYALSTLLVMLTHSRISEIAMVVLMLTMIIENRHWLAIQWSRFAGKLIIASVFTAAVVLSHTWVNTRERELITERNNNLVNDAEATSEGSRIALLHCGYEMLTESGYAGIGAGQFQHAMRERNWQSRTGGMVDPHCGILEIAAESGLTVAIAWIVALLLFVASSFKKKYALQSIAWMLMVAVLQFANSTFVSTPIAWWLLAWPILMYFEHENS